MLKAGETRSLAELNEELKSDSSPSCSKEISDILFYCVFSSVHLKHELCCCFLKIKFLVCFEKTAEIKTKNEKAHSSFAFDHWDA